MKQRNLPGIATSSALQQLSEHFERAGYFDIETMSYGISMIAVLQGDRLHTFVRGENLDDFLDILDRIPLLVSFNGISFDVPQVLRHFHLAELPCPHLDLRPVCKTHGLTGGLKLIEKSLGICRPDDVRGLGGDDAMLLWKRWEVDRDEAARRRVIRYCRADVVGLREIASHLIDQHVKPFAEPPPSLWGLLDQDTGACPGQEPAAGTLTPPVVNRGLYERLRAKARRTRGSSSLHEQGAAVGASFDDGPNLGVDGARADSRSSSLHDEGGRASGNGGPSYTRPLA